MFPRVVVSVPFVFSNRCEKGNCVKREGLKWSDFVDAHLKEYA